MTIAVDMGRKATKTKKNNHENDNYQYNDQHENDNHEHESDNHENLILYQLWHNLLE